MTKKGVLSLETVIQLIDQAAALTTLDSVGFTGGDPFLHLDVLEGAIRFATARSLKTRIVTSSYWAVSYDKAVTKLKPLVAAGLSELCLSYDDSHVKFVAEQNIINAYKVADHFGINITIYMSTDVGDHIDGAHVRRQLGVVDGEVHPRLSIVEAHVNSTGRAAVTASSHQKRLRAQRTMHLGPCPSILRQPAVTPSGKLLPCCGTTPFREGLCIGDIATDTIAVAMTKAYKNDLYKWIAFEGPVAVLKQITADTDAPLTEDDFDGICHACDVLFSSDYYQELARRYLEQKSDSLRLGELILSAVGLFASADSLTR
jgi:hypothetical protein